MIVNYMKTTKTKSNFSPEFIERVRAVILNEKSRLETELKNIANKNPHMKGSYEPAFPVYGDDEDANVKEVEEYTVNKPLEITLENSLRDIAKTLHRLDDGTYGTCKFCDKLIDQKRLLARPTSSACVSCKKLLTDEA